MKINVNGKMHDLASENLHDALQELGFANAKVATAINEEFVPAPMRRAQGLTDGDRLEIVAPMQGG
jgi:sulfur carrier protein